MRFLCVACDDRARWPKPTITTTGVMVDSEQVTDADELVQWALALHPPTEDRSTPGHYTQHPASPLCQRKDAPCLS